MSMSERVQNGGMDAAQFRAAMKRCHRATDLLSLFNARWHELEATYWEQVALRNEWAERYAALAEDGVPEGCNHPGRPAELVH